MPSFPLRRHRCAIRRFLEGLSRVYDDGDGGGGRRGESRLPANASEHEEEGRQFTRCHDL